MNQGQTLAGDELGIADVLVLISKVWKPAIIVGLVCASLALILSFILDPVYRAEVVLEYVGDPTKQGRPAGGAGDLGGIAALVGVNLESEGSPKEAALATLRSRAFARDFIDRYELMPVLNRDKWDEKNAEWREEPSEWRTVEEFLEKVLYVTEDPKTGLLTVSVEWHDPEIAARWATDIVSMINQRLKEITIKETNRSLAHLKAELEAAKNPELQRAIARLTESQIEALMFADIRDEFAFRTIDSAVVAPDDEYVFPSHLLFTGLGGIFGGIAGVLGALLMAFARKRRSN